MDVRLLARIACSIMFVALPCSVIAAPLGGSVDQFATRFNAQAKKLDVLDNVAVAKRSCQSGVKQACTYAVANGLSIVASSSEDKSTLNSLTLIMTSSESDATLAYVFTMGVIMSIYAPDASASERGVILKQLGAGLKGSTGGTAELHGISFALKGLEGMGLTTVITRE
ncbi:hypothetical protein V5F77_10455 [Xanthobacter sp. DSM 24535]|uniref:hypothetical protein n=1 Tax=Roseixanthobacter psychrophilus TaxID=3119917 RepID=UPI0037290C49